MLAETHRQRLSAGPDCCPDRWPGNKLTPFLVLTHVRGSIDVPEVGGDETKTRRRWDRAAGVVLAVIGLFLLVFTVVGFAPAVSNLGSGDEHLAGDATMTLVIAGPMLAVVVLSTLGCAWLLWRGWRGARALALVWIVGAGMFAAQDLAGGGDTWLARVIAMAAIAVAVLLLAGWAAKPPEAAVSG